MKKRYQLLAVVIMIVTMLTGCGTASRDMESPSSQAETDDAGAENTDTALEEDAGAQDVNTAQGVNDAGAENTDTAWKTDETSEENQRERVEVAGTAITEAPKGMNLYRTLPFFYGDEEWQLMYYVTAEVDENGELLLDDSCGFYLKAVSDTKEYLLFDEQVQLGVPEADVFTDIDGMLHIVVKDVRTAGYEVTNYVFDSEVEAFWGTVELKYEGINFMGGTE